MPLVMDAFNNLFNRKEKSKTLLKPEVNSRRVVRRKSLQFVEKSERLRIA